MKSRLWTLVFFIFTTVFSAIGFDAGLINQATLDVIFDRQPSPLLPEIIEVTKTQGFLVNLHIDHFERNPLESALYQEPQWLSAESNRIALLRAYRHYLLQSGDIGTTFGPIATMRPEKWDFNPHSFQYGGMYFYPMAFILKVASWVGYLHLNSDITFYITHPLEFRKFGLLGRGWIVVMNVLCTLFIFLAAKEWKGRTVGFLSALLFLLFPNSLSVAHTLKPHAAGLPWVVLAFWFALRFQKSSRNKDLWISSLAAGLAAGTSLNYAIFGLFPVLSLVVRERRACFGKLWRVLGIIAMIFVITNPYFFFNLDIVRKELAYHRWLSQHGTIQMLPALRDVFPKGMSWWMAACLFLSIFALLRDRGPTYRFLLIPPLVYFASFMILGGGNRAARMTSALYPFFGMICAYGLNQCMERWGRAGRGVVLVLLGMSFASAVCHLVNYWADSHGRSTMYQAGRWINSLPPGTGLGSISIPSPGGFPPYRFLDYKILITDNPMRLEARPAMELPAYFIALEPSMVNPKIYQLIKSFQPVSLPPRSWFGPHARMSEASPPIYVFKRMSASNSL